MPDKKINRSVHIGHSIPPGLRSYDLGPLAHELLSGPKSIYLNTKEGELPYSSLDLFALPSKELSYELAKRMIRNYPKSSESEKEFLTYINKLIKEANTYLRSEKGLNIPQILAFGEGERVKMPVPQINSKQDLEKILAELEVSKSKSGAQRNKKIALCALSKTVLALDDLQEVIRNIQEDADLIERLLVNGLEEAGVRSIFTVLANDPNMGACTSLLSEINGEQIDIDFCSRVKEDYSILSKMLLKPEFDNKEALKDAVGFRLSIDRKYIPELIKKFLSFLADLNNIPEDMSIHKLRLDIKGKILNKEDIEAVQKHADTLLEFFFDSHIPISADCQNSRSSGKYRDVKILFDITLKNGNESRNRSVEIQIIDRDSRNESGLSNHSVYKLKQKMGIFTRLYGSIPIKWLEEEVRRLSIQTRLDYDKVMDALLKSTVKITIPGRKTPIFMEKDVFNRLAASRLIPEQLTKHAKF